MRLAPDPAYRYRPGWRERVPALLLALGLVALILLALARLGLLPSAVDPPQSDLNTFNVAPPSPTAGGATRPPEPTKAAAEATAPPPAAPRPPPPPPVPRPPDAPALVFPDILILRGDQFARSDIGRLPTEKRGAAPAASGADTAAAYGPGEGPGGERLFNAEWHVEPTNAQLTGYLPPTGAPPGSWATIACRTIEKYEVENCRALGESPVGSGLARAMRQAAWQFRVRPPRIGGRPQIGAWVRILITFEAKPE